MKEHSRASYNSSKQPFQPNPSNRTLLLPPDLRKNLPLFIAFRLLFNARFYYPIFAVIQLDYGLTMSQFAILNAIWAASIVLLEVPSGALADKIGRRKMVVLAAFLMVAEMALIAFVPLGNNTLVFWIWALNRVLSGAAEASASGADEALAYDSIPAAEQTERWPQVLARLMTLSSLAFIVAMLLGAAVYDQNLVNGVLAWLGTDLVLEKETVIRFPIYLTLLTSFGAVAVSLAMREPPVTEPTEDESVGSLWKNIFAAGAWILRTPVVFCLILAALVHDSLIRIMLTMNSEYYRLIKIPEAAFGIIGASFAAVGLITPTIARRLTEKKSPPTNYLIVSVFTLLGLIGVAFAIPYYGVAVVIFFAVGFSLLNFFSSHYLNSRVDSRRRATVLSFKGLALNIGFGLLSVLYALLLKSLRENADLSDSTAADPAFPASLPYLPVAFVFLWLLLAAYFFLKVRNLPDSKK